MSTYDLQNWKTQIKKGYLELCILSLIHTHETLYGLVLIEELKKINLVVKEGTLYPLLSRMLKDGVLKAKWETEGIKGHPRKFYSLTAYGVRTLEEMKTTFLEMNQILRKVRKTKIKVLAHEQRQ